MHFRKKTYIYYNLVARSIWLNVQTIVFKGFVYQDVTEMFV